MSKKSKETFKQSVFALLISQVLVKGLGLIYKLYLTNRPGFGDEGNAISSAGFQVYALILSITATGLPGAISRIVSNRTSKGDHKGAYKVFKISMLIFGSIGLAGSYFLCVFAKQIANNYLNIKEAELSILALSPSVFIVAVISVFRGYFNGRENLKEMARGQSIDQITKTITTFLFIEGSVFLTVNPNTTIMAACANFSATLANLFECLYLFSAFLKQRKEIKSDLQNNIVSEKVRTVSLIKEIIRVAIPISLTAIIGSIAKNIDSTTIVNELKNIIGYENAKKEYGILSGKVETLIMFPLSFNTAITTALMPTMASASYKLKEKETRINKSIMFGMSIVMPIVAIFLCFADEILKFLFPNASSGAMILRISSISIIFITITQMLNVVLYGIGKSRIPIIAVTLGVIVKAVLNKILIPKVNLSIGGTNGAAIATVMYNLVGFLVCIIAIRKYTDIRIHKINIIKPAIASIFMVIIIKIVFNIINHSIFSLLIAFLVGAISYIISLFLLRIIKLKDFYFINLKR